MKKRKVKKLIKRIEVGTIIWKRGGFICIDPEIDIKYREYIIVVDKKICFGYCDISRVKVYKYKTKEARKANKDNNNNS